ncbi:MAG: C39 family peptidase [Anaerolineaceae bacterium]
MFKSKRNILILIACLILILGCALVFNARVQEWVGWHTAQALVWLKVQFDPPEEVAFTSPGDTTQNLPLPVITTPTSSAPDVPGTIQPEETILPAVTSVSLPDFVELDGITYFSQHNRWSYCGPANLAMALSYWGWEGTHDDVAHVVKPYPKDKSVMPYELVDYIQTETDLDALTRVGGDLELLKRLIASGYPVIVEKGPYFRDISYRITWMGHYQLLTGYNDAKAIFIAQDSYINADYEQEYAVLVDEWRSFNYTYIVVFPKNERNDVLNLLGENSDEDQNYRLAAQKAVDEIYSLEGLNQFFAWFNYGTNLVYLRDYSGAADAYDQAFTLYNALPNDNTIRPYRILWYETGPYYAYYFMARYQDVIDLATNNSIDMVRDDEPALEESYYWRGRAKVAVGDQEGAIEDFMTCLTYHSGFNPCIDELNALGIFL